MPKGAVSVGINAHAEVLRAAAVEAGIVITNNNNSGFPDLGFYYTYSGGAGVGGAGVGLNASAYSQGRSKFDGYSKSINPCFPIVCTSAHFDEEGKHVGQSVSRGAQTPSISATLNKTQSVMVEDVLKLPGYVSDVFEDGGYKRKKEEEERKRWKQKQK